MRAISSAQPACRMSIARSGRNVGRTSPAQPDIRMRWCHSSGSLAASVVHSTSILNRSNSLRGRNSGVERRDSMRVIDALRRCRSQRLVHTEDTLELVGSQAPLGVPAKRYARLANVRQIARGSRSTGPPSSLGTPNASRGTPASRASA